MMVANNLDTTFHSLRIVNIEEMAKDRVQEGVQEVSPVTLTSCSPALLSSKSSTSSCSSSVSSEFGDLGPLPCAPRAARRSTISFGNVEIREYDRTVGVNPSCSDGGPALDLDWTYRERNPISIDNYENYRFYDEPRRQTRHMRLRCYQREKILINDHSVTMIEIHSARKQINKSIEQRKMTLLKMKFERFHLAEEKIVSKTKKVLGLKKSSKEEIEALWQKPKVSPSNPKLNSKVFRRCTI